MVHKALTIAGSDSGGGAGIQADLKTFQELGVYGMSVITAITAQNTKGVQGVYPVEPAAVLNQLSSIADDLPPEAVKTGMLFSSDIIEGVADFISSHAWSKLVVDPVMIAKGGASLLQKQSVQALIDNLIPLAYVITPNIPEAEVLTGLKIQSDYDRKEAAKKLFDMGARHVVIKGGHDTFSSSKEATDLLFDGNEFYEFRSIRVNTKHTHGTGCTFASAVTAELAKGHSVYESVHTAKLFITSAILNEIGIGNGHGPTNHWAFNKAGVRV
ncbi:bifunctional hydroxymethylpyrimidine kinase/phosphomethylpyrimidine kinase [Peribacillus alkalitolerans]|uniref:bifunctional hydroxymethylpyrimidine kinase/phosphomethylpyrimidine kinase n=1 Tax=Peribacillus alkalitolerans TaxID=1550385 RepID=UPI0013D4CD9F|nr:bifunctional hydroxymethylpyrimidine kinase/phosphomethylpyrimidine kinase [Peribacillus alkalitolerans]